MSLLKLTLMVIIAMSACKYRNPRATAMKSDALISLGKQPLAERYAKECSDAGVVLPKEIGDKRFWSEHRIVDTAFPHFSSAQNGGDMYIHSDDRGGCIQLQTESKTSFDWVPSEFNAFAICWSATGSVCFWEQPRVPPKILNTTFNIALNDEASVYGAKTIPCTGCHRGDNPFIGHGELGDPAFSKFPKVGFTRPIGLPSWFKNLPDSEIAAYWKTIQKGDDSYQCGGECHSIPKIDPKEGYCSIATTMMHSGLMLGPELNVRNDFKPAKVAAQVPLNEINLEQCAQYVSFVKACELEPVKDFVGSCPVD